MCFGFTHHSPHPHHPPSQRRILRKESRQKGSRALKQKRPRSRTLTTVHENILEDLVFPSDIVGKRIRFRGDGKKLIKV